MSPISELAESEAKEVAERPGSWAYIAASSRGVTGLLDVGEGMLALASADGRPGLVGEGLAWQPIAAAMPPPGVQLCGADTSHAAFS